MAWSVVQSAANAIDGSSISKAFTTANVSSGNKIIVAVGHNGPTGVPTVKDGANNSWTHVAQATAGNIGVDLFALDVPSGDVGTKPTITATFSSGAGLGICIMEVSGLLAGDTSAMWDGTPGTKTGSTSSTGSPTYASAAASEFLVSAYGDLGDGNTVVKTTGWTMVGNNGSTSANALIQYKDSTGGTETDGFTSADTGGWGIVTVAFPLASASGDASVTPSVIAATASIPAPSVSDGVIRAEYVQNVVTTTSSISGNNLILTVDTGVTTTEGNAVVVWASDTNSRTITGVTDSQGNTWQVDEAGVGTGGTCGIASTVIASGKALVAGDTITVTFTSSAASGKRAGAAEFANLDTTGGALTVQTSHSTHDTATPGSNVTTSAGAIGDLVVAGIGFTTALTPTITATDASSGGTWTDMSAPSGSSNADGAYQVAAGTSAYTAAWTFSGNATMTTVVYKVATVTTLDANITATAVAATSTIPTPTITAVKTASVSPSVIAAAATIPTPVVHAGETATPPVIAAAATIPTPTIVAVRSASISATVIAATATIPDPTKSAGSTVSPISIGATSEIPTPSIMTSAGVSASAIPGTATIPTPTITAVLNATVTPSVIAATATIPPPSISTAAGANVTPAVIAATSSIPSPVLATGATATPLNIAATVSFPASSFSSSVDVAPSVIAGSSTISTPELVNSTNVLADVVAATATIPAPDVQTSGNVSISPSAVAATATIPTPTITAVINSTVTPSSIAATATIPSVGVITSTVVTPSVISAAATIPTAAVSTGLIRHPADLGGTLTQFVYSGIVTTIDPGFSGTATITGYSGTTTPASYSGLLTQVDPGFGGIVTQPAFTGTVTQTSYIGTVKGWTMQIADITLLEHNDETIDVVIKKNGSNLDITDYTIEAYLKTAASVADDDASTIALSTTTGEITITDAANGGAEIAIPATDLTDTVSTFWRLDVILSSKRNTVFSGAVVVTPL